MQQAPRFPKKNLFVATLPLLVMTAMTLTGLALTTADLRESLGRPLRLAGLLVLQRAAAIALPAGPVMLQTGTGLLAPIAMGMAIRQRAPRFVQRWAGRLRAASMVLLTTLLSSVTVFQAFAIREQAGVMIAAAALFTQAGTALGLAAARLLHALRGDALTLAVAVNVPGRLEFLNFSVVFFATQALLVVPAILLARPAPTP